MGRSILALPLEFCRRQKTVFVLERLDLTLFVERDKEKCVRALPQEALRPSPL
jgi:hypothetical protein